MIQVVAELARVRGPKSGDFGYPRSYLDGGARLAIGGASVPRLFFLGHDVKANSERFVALR